jgi:general secretion pathway protein C
MKHLFNPKTTKGLWAILVVLLVVKLFWFLVEVTSLSTSGNEHVEQKGGKALYYRVKLSPNEAPPPTAGTRPQEVAGSIKDITLLAIYNASDVTVVTVEHKRKTKVLSKGEAIDGFVLEGAGSNYATFGKESKTYRVPLLVSTKGNTSSVNTVPSEPETSSQDEPQGDVVDAGDHKIVDKSLIAHYAKNIDDVYKNIGIVEVKKGDALDGFSISFIRKGSVFEKLGVRRGDVIKSVNGEKIDSYNAAFGVYKNISNINNLSLVVERGKEEVELEYEVN